MIKHSENVRRVTAARTVEGAEFDSIEVDYVTAGGVSKTLKLAHSDADALRALLIGEIEAMPDEHRKRSFFNSLRRKR